jgi:integrase
MARKQKPVRVERGLYRSGKTYLACATPPGSRTVRWKTIGEVGLMQARSERDAWVTKVRAGRAPRVDHTTVAQVAEAWLAHIADRVARGDLAPRTEESYRNGVEQHLLKRLGPREIRSITVEDLIEWHRVQRAGGASKWSIRARWMAVRGVFAFAVRHGWREDNPTDKLLSSERPKPGDRAHRYLGREEIAALLAVEDRDLVALGVFTGMRASGLLGLTLGEIDFAGDVIHVRYQMSRQGQRVKLKSPAARRDIVLMPALAKILRRRRLEMPRSSDADLVYQSGTGATMGYWTLQDRFDKAVSEAGIGHATFHALRHTFASILIGQGHDVEFVRDQLGHAHSSTTLDTYSHLFDARRHAEKARTELEAEFGSMLGTGRAG